MSPDSEAVLLHPVGVGEFAHRDGLAGRCATLCLGVVPLAGAHVHEQDGARRPTVRAAVGPVREGGEEVTCDGLDMDFGVIFGGSEHFPL